MKFFGFSLLCAFVSCSGLLDTKTINDELATERCAAEQRNMDIEGGSFSLLTYNVAGLPSWISQSDPDVNSIQISPLLNNYDIVLVQEDWDYHQELTKHVNHEYLSSHSGTAGFGSGLNRMSRYKFAFLERITWNDSYGFFSHANDSLAPKGFTMARHFLSDGVVVDIYNHHADAGGSDGDHKARRGNFRQMMDAINRYSTGNAVIVAGDTNSGFGDNNEIRLLTDAGFSDGWADMNNNGIIPEVGQSGGRIDKILYRSSDSVTLTLNNFYNPKDLFKDKDGKDLSDHQPRAAEFSFMANIFPKISLKSSHNKYIVAEHNGGSAVNADRGKIGEWETFTLLNNDSDPGIIKNGDKVSIRTGNGYLLCADSNGNLAADRKWAGSWETFTLINHTSSTRSIQNGDVVSLRSAHNKYVVGESDGDCHADRSAIGSWEKFTIQIH